MREGPLLFVEGQPVIRGGFCRTIGRLNCDLTAPVRDILEPPKGSHIIKNNKVLISNDHFGITMTRFVFCNKALLFERRIKYC